MKILNLKPVTDRGGGTKTLAVFDIELTEEIRVYGCKLIENSGRRLTYAPSANGGRRTATFAPALAERITAAAIHAYEGQTTANGSIRAK